MCIWVACLKFSVALAGNPVAVVGGLVVGVCIFRIRIIPIYFDIIQNGIIFVPSNLDAKITLSCEICALAGAKK